MYLFVAAAWAAPVPDELAEIPRRRLYHYRERPPPYLNEPTVPPDPDRGWVPGRRYFCVLTRSRLDWDDEIRASIDEIR